MARVVGSLPPTWETQPGRVSGFWPQSCSLGCCAQVGSELVDGSIIFFSAFQINEQANKQLKKKVEILKTAPFCPLPQCHFAWLQGCRDGLMAASTEGAGGAA